MNPQIPGWDLRLLRMLSLLVAESGVSRVAEQLGQSQPAVSATLKRLRELTGDPLLVRSGSHLVPTERAVELKREADRILRGIDSLSAPAQKFDPLTCARHLRIVATTCFSVLLVPLIVRRVRESAPHLTLELFQAPADGSVDKVLEKGEVDLVLGNWPAPALDFRIAQLFESETVCVFRRGHGLARRHHLGLDDYLAQEHLSPTLMDGAARSPIDGRLLQIGRKRRVMATVPEFGLVPHVLQASDLVFTTAREFAEHIAASLPLSIVEAPPELGRMTLFMLWHERTHASPVHRWMRGLIRTVATDVIGQPLPGRRPSLQAV